MGDMKKLHNTKTNTNIVEMYIKQVAKEKYKNKNLQKRVFCHLMS